MIKLFLEHGGNVHSRNKSGETPLHIMAQHRGSYDCIELLIDAGDENTHEQSLSQKLIIKAALDVRNHVENKTQSSCCTKKTVVKG